jgi:hypothetical protein
MRNFIMSTAKPMVPSKPGSSSLQRPYFSPGLLLEDEDLNVAVSYTQELMRLMLKSLFGCGVICGLKVTAIPTCQDTKRKIQVTRGIALDCQGNLIEVPVPWSYEFGPDCDDGYPPKMWVVLCYHEKCCRPKDVTCSSDDESQSKPTRIQSGYEIKLYDCLPDCACRCRSEDDDDEDSPDGPTHSCCNEPTPKRSTKKSSSTAEQATDTSAEGDESGSEELCPCYGAHFHGVCDCECGCKCVVLGKVVDFDDIHEEDDQGNPVPPYIEVDDSMVRRVRPVLNGYFECRFPEAEATQRTTSSMASVRQEPASRQVQTAQKSLQALRQGAKDRQKEKYTKEEKAKVKEERTKDEKS